MTKLKNKLQAPLVIPLPERDPLYFGPLEIKSVADKVLDAPLVKLNIENGNLQVLPEETKRSRATRDSAPKEGGDS